MTHLAAFEYSALPGRIVFGWGTRARVRAEVERLGAARALVLATPGRTAQSQAVLENLVDLGAGIFSEAVMHTPVDVTERALERMRELGADCTVAIGGGSTTGLGKAIARRLGSHQVVLPTTYAGSEVTPILGETESGVKTTMQDMALVPDTVIYDVELTFPLPLALSVTSAFNAMAHAVEALYARDRNPLSSLLAAAGVRAFVRALPVIARDPGERQARGEALKGAWFCGSVLGQVGMALHHKLCHVLGGAFDLPHAETHAVMLPHATAFNATRAGDLLAPVAQALGADEPGLGLHEFAKSLGAPTALRDLGMPEDGIDHAADLAVKNPYWNPRPFDRGDITALIEAAWAGRAPRSG